MLKDIDKCQKLSFDDAVDIQMRLLDGEKQSRIVRDYDVNQGRISEINTGKLHPGSHAEALRRIRARNRKHAR